MRKVSRVKHWAGETIVAVELDVVIGGVTGAKPALSWKRNEHSAGGQSRRWHGGDRLLTEATGTFGIRSELDRLDMVR
jgi:hypothetical protein